MFEFGNKEPLLTHIAKFQHLLISFLLKLQRNYGNLISVRFLVKQKIDYTLNMKEAVQEIRTDLGLFDLIIKIW